MEIQIQGVKVKKKDMAPDPKLLFKVFLLWMTNNTSNMDKPFILFTVIPDGVIHDEG